MVFCDVLQVDVTGEFYKSGYVKNEGTGRAFSQAVCLSGLSEFHGVSPVAWLHPLGEDFLYVFTERKNIRENQNFPR